ncbi:hypothetical protein HOLleu_11640 [Holothuria leucospilota]|uniref:Uncharacterized protein n=1 Tax=Holothuria leucospilota TaxID=206669 RepID=A0A9Q1CF18_HOLLE|nr:hypothetical protein HOLleu_11640 [Holothuria leucospilota]
MGRFLPTIFCSQRFKETSMQQQSRQASFYETIGIFSYEAVALVSTISVGDMVTKITLGIFGERLYFPKMYLVLFHNVIMIIVSCILPVANNYFQIFLLSSIIGLMRPLGNNLPYLMGEELLGSEYVDEAVSITCMACGVGLVLGTFPVGKCQNVVCLKSTIKKKDP